MLASIVYFPVMFPIESVEGCLYQLEKTTALTQGNWQAVGEPVMGSGELITLLDPDGMREARAFYRVLVDSPNEQDNSPAPVITLERIRVPSFEGELQAAIHDAFTPEQLDALPAVANADINEPFVASSFAPVGPDFTLPIEPVPQNERVSTN